MASSCSKLCLRCRSFLCSKTATTLWKYSTQARHCIPGTRIPVNFLHGFPVPSEDHKMAQTKLKWKQQVLFYSNLSAGHQTTKDKEDKVSKDDLVAHKNPSLPVIDAVVATESNMLLGTCSFSSVDNLKNYSIEHLLYPT